MPQQIEVPATWDSIATLLAFSDSLEAALPLTPDQSYLLRLVVEEIATNIVKYGYATRPPGVIQFACSCEGGTLRVMMRDQGLPFDPRDHPAPDLSSSDPASRSIGGLGLFFVRELADQIDYTHDPVSGWNELTVTKGS